MSLISSAIKKFQHDSRAGKQASSSTLNCQYWKMIHLLERSGVENVYIATIRAPLVALCAIVMPLREKHVLVTVDNFVLAQVKRSVWLRGVKSTNCVEE